MKTHNKIHTNKIHNNKIHNSKIHNTSCGYMYRTSSILSSASRTRTGPPLQHAPLEQRSV